MRRLLLIFSLLGFTTGCMTHLTLPTKSPLTTPALAKNSVILDVLFVRFSPNDAEMTETVWEEIDELHFSPELRRRLESNGFRAGIISGPMPILLERRLQLSTNLTTTDAANAESEPKPIDPEHRPTAKQRQLRIGAGRRANILVLGERERRPELSVLMRTDDGRVEGRTYEQVQGLFATRAFPQGDGGVRLEMTPELEHGKPQKRFVPGDGMFQIEFGPPHEVLDQLRCSAQLAPGQMLVVTARPQRPGSLGHQFFTDVEAETQVQKMLLVRLAHSEYDDRFSASPVAAPDGK